ncbi:MULTISPECIES: glycogen debranching protein GlgX [unclassified Sphingomonas]|uniref:glycogen debranching protein GlgX n=1 Tax=unclassified Sphingomonas TaxID=196159 RepID=UPI0006FAA081|nr:MULTISPECIES: glycogen debranching protein GlgX [unclassified Sphingomonas]KQM66860.1 glycogen debranching protein [Sphingomonas sp. Leaf16]KQN17808.1 glycogen debranching protein [Sphingomonas sp. Leaf29]KQN23671.1 glycogen debranching protein [Sphingomonas sp. Leaf32]
MTLGTCAIPGGTRFSVRARDAAAMWLCLFDGDAERRIAMTRDGDGFVVEVPGAGPGQRYGYRAAGEWAPAAGRWFDPAKLLVDPYAVELDRRFVHDPALSQFGADTAAIVPRAIVPALSAPAPVERPRIDPARPIYELNVRGFTMQHPDIPEEQRGTIAALAHPSIIAHLQGIGVGTVELMPIVAWIDERHLPPLGLRNAWGYNPVVPMAIDPGLALGGVAELRETIAALHAAGIGVILDLVFNHSGESDRDGPILSLRGLDDRSYAHAPDGTLINDTGTGNTLDAGDAGVRDLILATLRHFAALGVDGFRFDLAPVIARSPGFDRHAPIFAAIAADPLLRHKVMIAEPWDIGPGGYQLGNFPPDWLEWNDRYRDDVRRFWRGDGGVGQLATRLMGSADIFGPVTRSVNFLAAHDGFTLADLVSHVERHNHANGEDNRDGHGDNLSWNHGVEGPSDEPAVIAARTADLRALLATLFATRGYIQLTAGDEFGRSQRGNNNAYAQDNAIGWVDWDARDVALEEHVATLAAWRRERPTVFDTDVPQQATWLALDGQPMTAERWEAPDCPGFELHLPGATIRIDRPARTVTLR